MGIVTITFEWSGQIPPFDSEISTWGEESTLESSLETSAISGEWADLSVGYCRPECIGIPHASSVELASFYLLSQHSGSESQI